MVQSERNRYMCLFCGEFAQAGPGFASVNFHHFETLELNSKRTKYSFDFQMGGAHKECLSRYLANGEMGVHSCAVCNKRITSAQTNRATKIAVYEFRKKGCSALIGVHDKCFRTVKHSSFPFLKLPKLTDE